jgi:hypothetical protein
VRSKTDGSARFLLFRQEVRPFTDKQIDQSRLQVLQVISSSPDRETMAALLARRGPPAGALPESLLGRRG